MGAVASAAFAYLPGYKGACLHGDHAAALALLRVHRRTADWAVFSLGNEIDTGEALLGARRSPDHLGCRPPSPAGMMMKPSQQFVAPPFLPASASS
jgi:hypothetical protein